jgi:Flp pilus assembly protein TadD
VFFIARRVFRDLGRGSATNQGETRLGWEWQAAVCTASLWALHPIQTDAVTYISGRRDILSTLFFLVGFLAFLIVRMDGSWMRTGRRVSLIIVAFLAYMLGLASKEMAVTLPLLMFAYDFVREPLLAESSSFDHSRSGFLRRATSVVWQYRLLYLPLFLGAAVFTWYAIFEIRPSRGWGWYGGSALNNFLTVARVWVFYLSLLVRPHVLIADYTGLFPIVQSVSEKPALVAVGLLSVGFALICFAVRRNFLVFAFAGLWFAITLLPVSHLIPHHELMAEHYLYLPSIGFCLLLGYILARSSDWLAHREWKWASVIGPGVGYSILVWVLILYGNRVITRNADWKDELTFYSRLVEDNPFSARARLGLGAIYDRSGMPRIAITNYQVGIKLSPGDPRLYANIGTSYQKLGMLKEAEQAYLIALKILPNEQRVLSNLGFLYTELQQYDKARANLERAEQLSHGKDPAVYANLGGLYEALGDLPQAIQAYQKAVTLAPGNRVFAGKLKLLEKELEEKARGSQKDSPAS